MERITLSTPDELELLEFIEEDLLTEQPEQRQFQSRTEQVYNGLVERDPKFRYRAYQPKYAAMVCVRGENILGHKMGAGKTLQSILAIAALYLDIKTRVAPGRVHIVVPNVLAAMRWLDDLDRVAELSDCYELVKTEADLNRTTKPILIYTHDYPKLKRKAKKDSKRPHLYRLLGNKFRPSLLVIDELHLIGTKNTQRYKHLLYIRERAKRVLGLTGSLTDGKLEMMDSLNRFIYRRNWGFEENQFPRIFRDRRKLSTNYLTGSNGESTRYLDHLEYSKVEDYYELMRRFVHRLTLDDPEVKDSVDYPQPEFHEVWVEPTAQQKHLYSDYINSQRQLLDTVAQATDPRFRYKALNLIHPLVTIANTGELEETEKLTPKAAALIQLINSHKKVAVFCDRVVSSRYLHRILSKELGEEAVVRLYAQDELATPKKLSDDARCEVVSKFQFDSSVKVGIFSSNLASVSIDLTAADAVVFYCLPWQSLKVYQGISRASRPGNTNDSVQVYYLANRGLIDEHQLVLVREKLKVSRMLLDYEDIDESVTEGEESAPEGGDVNPNKALQELLRNL